MLKECLRHEGQMRGSFVSAISPTIPAITAAELESQPVNDVHSRTVNGPFGILFLLVI